jgi:hypothetical protein
MVFSNNLLLGAVSAAAGDYLIEQSLLFDGAAYLDRTPSTAGNRKTWTFSCWLKRGELGVSDSVFSAGDGGSNYSRINFQADNTLIIVAYTGGSAVYNYQTSAVFRDTSAWYHIVVQQDVAAGAVALWVNGVSVALNQLTQKPINYDGYINSTFAHSIGRLATIAAIYSGLMALPILVDGAALDATSFGEEDADGYWNPIAFVGDYNVLGSTPTVSSASALWTGNTATWTFTADDISGPTGTDAAVRIMDYAFSDDFSVQWTHRTTASSSYTIGVYPTASDASFNAATYYAGVFYVGGIATSFSVRFDSSTTYSLWGGTSAEQSSLAVADNDVMKFERVGSTFKVYKNAALIRTMTFTSTSQMRIALGRGAACDMETVTFDYEIVDGVNGGAYDFSDSSWFGKDVNTTAIRVPSASGEWTAGTGFTISGDGVASNGAQNSALKSVDTFTGDFTFEAKWTTANRVTMGCYEISEDGTFLDTARANAEAMTAAWWFTENYYPAGYWYGGTNRLSGMTFSNGDTLRMTRISGVFRVYINGVLQYTYTDTSSNEVRLIITINNYGTSTINNIFWIDHTTGAIGNNFTDSGFVAADQLADTPTDDVDLEIGNFFNFDPNATNAAVTLAEGNTKATFTTAASDRANITGVTLPTSGKWYFEVEVTTLVAEVQIGVNLIANYAARGGNIGDSTGEIAYRSDGRKRESGSTTTFGATLPSGSLVGVAWDGDANKIWFAKANSWQASGNPSAGTSPANSGTISTASYFAVKSYNSSVVNLNTGGKGFTYTPPTGFVALATQNLPAPTIADGSDYFNTVIYAGDGNASGTAREVGFRPDLVWIKSRTASTGSTYNHTLTDSIRGVNSQLSSNSTAAETGLTNALTSFNDTGFTVAQNVIVNYSGDNYVAWCWKAGGTAVSNTVGSITSSVSANPTSGFSIATYTGIGSSGTVGHGLGAAPKFIIIKSRSNASTNWRVYHDGLGGITKYLLLNSTAAVGTASMWGTPGTTAFTIGGATYEVNETGQTYVAYCWAEVEGFSKFGSYTGNGSTDGPFIFTGFKPAFVLIKRTNSTGNWYLYDVARSTFNEVDDQLLANTSAAETTGSEEIDILSNGFKHRSADAEVNASGGIYIFAAYAENPFQGDEGYTQARAR